MSAKLTSFVPPKRTWQGQSSFQSTISWQQIVRLGWRGLRNLVFESELSQIWGIEEIARKIDRLGSQQYLYLCSLLYQFLKTSPDIFLFDRQVFVVPRVSELGEATIGDRYWIEHPDALDPVLMDFLRFATMMQTG